VTVTAAVDESVTSSSEVNKELETWLKQKRTEVRGVQLEAGGEYEDTEKSIESLVEAFLIAMGMIFIILATITFYELTIKEPAPHALPRMDVETHVASNDSANPAPTDSAKSALIQGFSGRNLFQPPIIEEEKPQKPEKTVFLKDLAAPLSLMGVVDGETPQAIIQDQKTQKTYFLYEGDYLGDILIEKVDQGIVSLSFDGEEMDLRF